MASFVVGVHAATPIEPTFIDRYDYIGCNSFFGNIAAADVNGDGIPDLRLRGIGGADLSEQWGRHLYIRDKC